MAISFWTAYKATAGRCHTNRRNNRREVTKLQLREYYRDVIGTRGGGGDVGVLPPAANHRVLLKTTVLSCYLKVRFVS